MVMSCQVKVRNNLFCKGIKVIDGLCSKHLQFKLNEYNLDELTLCSKCGSFTQYNRTCLVCNNTQCKALDRNDNFCRSFTENNNAFCNRHIQVGLDKLSNEELQSLERCKTCRNKYKLNGKCLVCEKKLCKAFNQKGEPCQFSVFEDYNFCKTHQELYGHFTDDEFSRLVKCHGMCKTYFLPKENEKYLTCPKCRGTSKDNRDKTRSNIQCNAIASYSKKQCTNRAEIGYEQCSIHNKDIKIKEEESKGIFRCKSKYGCSIILDDNHKNFWCKLCRFRVSYYKENLFNSNPHYKLAALLRLRCLDALQKQNLIKDDHTENLIGCSFDFLKTYLESKFLPGMNWSLLGNNTIEPIICEYCNGIRTGIHIDHIKPVSKFNLENDEIKLEIFHYTNLQLLYNCCNTKKSNLYVIDITKDNLKDFLNKNL